MTCFPPDVKCFGTCDVGTVTVPLMHNEVIKQQPVNFLDLERAYSDFAINFITTSVKNSQPFFLYYPSHVSASTRVIQPQLKMCFQNVILVAVRHKYKFLYIFILQHTHYPQYAGPGAAGQSLRGPFGDALLEFDNTVGNLLTTLEKTGVINNTLVFFTSDNGWVCVSWFIYRCKLIYSSYGSSLSYLVLIDFNSLLQGQAAWYMCLFL